MNNGMTDRMNRLQLLTLVIPLIFSLLFAFSASVIALILWAVSVFAVISFVPVFDKRENLWAFLCVALSGIPANVYLVIIIMEWEFFGFVEGFLAFLFPILLYALLFSIEEIVFGVAIRFFHPRQYKLNI